MRCETTDSADADRRRCWRVARVVKEKTKTTPAKIALGQDGGQARLTGARGSLQRIIGTRAHRSQGATGIWNLKAWPKYGPIITRQSPVTKERNPANHGVSCVGSDHTVTPTGLGESAQDTANRDIYKESVFASVSDIRRSVAVLQENGIGELARWFDGLLPPNAVDSNL